MAVRSLFDGCETFVQWLKVVHLLYVSGVTEDDQTETSMRHLCGMVVDWLQDTAEDNPLGDLCEQVCLAVFVTETTPWVICVNI